MSIPTDRQRPPAYRFVVGTLRPLFMAITRRDWSGQEHLPAEGGYVACTNHYSYADPFVFGHFLVDSGATPHYLGKVEVFRIPVVGRLLKAADQIPVYRESGKAQEAYAAAVAAVRAGQCVAIYPEGTLTRDPDLWPMRGKTGAARIALETGCPVIPIANWGAQHVLGPYSKVPRLLPRSSVQVKAGPPVPLDDLHGVPMTGEVLRQATDRIMDAITALLEEIRGEVAPTVRFDPRAHGVSTTGRPSVVADPTPHDEESTR